MARLPKYTTAIIVLCVLVAGGVAARMVLTADSPIERVFTPTTRSSSSASAALASSRAASVSPTSRAPSASSAPAATTSSATAPAPSPNSVLIEVPFVSQAPFGNWDALHEETCEEASLILALAYLNGERTMPETEMEKRLQDLVAWQTANGYGYDVSMEELNDISEAKYGVRGRIVENPSIAEIKEILAEGHPIVAPFAGRELGNPYYSGEGPWYHVLVIIGYDGTHFITNDVGTKRGSRYRYRYQTLWNALHDWTGVKEETNTGPKRILVFGE